MSSFELPHGTWRKPCPKLPYSTCVNLLLMLLAIISLPMVAIIGSLTYIIYYTVCYLPSRLMWNQFLLRRNSYVSIYRPNFPLSSILPTTDLPKKWIVLENAHIHVLHLHRYTFRTCWCRDRNCSCYRASLSIRILCFPKDLCRRVAGKNLTQKFRFPLKLSIT